MAWKAAEGMESEDVQSTCARSVVGAAGRIGALTTKPVPQYRQTPGEGQIGRAHV